MRSRKGFTLVEIMIVVAIIVLLAAIAIPNLLRARLSANEATSIAAMRTLSTAMETFRSSQSPPVYADALADLSNTTPPYIDSVLGSGTKGGYGYNLTGLNTSYTIVATPVSANVTGVRGFFVDESGVVRASASGTASVASSPIE